MIESGREEAGWKSYVKREAEDFLKAVHDPKVLGEYLNGAPESRYERIQARAAEMDAEKTMQGVSVVGEGQDAHLKIEFDVSREIDAIHEAKTFGLYEGSGNIWSQMGDGQGRHVYSIPEKVMVYFWFRYGRWMPTTDYDHAKEFDRIADSDPVLAACRTGKW